MLANVQHHTEHLGFRRLAWAPGEPAMERSHWRDVRPSGEKARAFPCSKAALGLHAQAHTEPGTPALCVCCSPSTLDLYRVLSLRSGVRPPCLPTWTFHSSFALQSPLSSSPYSSPKGPPCSGAKSGTLACSWNALPKSLSSFLTSCSG